MIEAGTRPLRKPGKRASFWYFWISASVSRLTSAAGTSTAISRFVLSFASVGLTGTPFRLRRSWGQENRTNGGVKPPRLRQFSVKTAAEQRQTRKVDER